MGLKGAKSRRGRLPRIPHHPHSRFQGLWAGWLGFRGRRRQRIWAIVLAFTTAWITILGTQASQVLGAAPAPAPSTLTLPSPAGNLVSSLTLGELDPTMSPDPQERLRQGQALYGAERFQDAIDLWGSTLPSWAADPARGAIVRTLMAQAHTELAQWSAAQDQLDQAQTLVDPLANSPVQGFVQGKLATAQGNLYLAQGQLQSAYGAYRQAEQAYDRAEDSWGHLQSRLNQAKVLQLQGFGSQALQEMQTWMGEVDDLPDSPLKVQALRQIAEIWAMMGDRTQASLYGTQSLTLAQTLQNIPETLESFLSLGRLTWDDSRQATTAFRAVIAQGRDYPLYQMQAQVNLMRLALFSNRLAEQLNTLFDEANAQLAQVPLSRDRVFARLNMVETVLHFPDWKNRFGFNDGDVTEPLRQALADSDDLRDDRLQAYTLGLWGRYFEGNQAWDQARRYTEDAIERSQRVDDGLGLYQWQWQLGRVLNAQGQLTQAKSAYGQAIDTLKTLRSDLANLSADLSFSFLDKIAPVYRQYVKLLLTPEGQQPVSQDDLRLARNTLEDLHLEELVNFFKANCVTAQTLDIDTLDPQAAVIYPVLLQDSLGIIVSFPDQTLRHYSGTYSRGAIEAASELLRSALAESSNSQRWRRSLDQENGGSVSQALRIVEYLYTALIRPIAPDLESAGIKTLVFALDGALRNIPMGVLSDGDHYLIEDYSIAVSPSLQLLESQPIDLTDLSVLIGGVTEGGEVAVGTSTQRGGGRSQVFTPLPFVKQEVYTIQQAVNSVLLLNGGQTLSLDNINVTPEAENRSANTSTTLVDNVRTSGPTTAPPPDATPPQLTPQGPFEQETLLRELRTGHFPIVHFATHGQFTSEADQTFVLAWNDTLTLDDIRDLLQPIDRSGAKPIELLVLSACQTALGDNRAALGLAGMAVRSGARSTIATLWSVDDQATSELMGQFYTNLVHKQLSRSEALRQAQLTLLHSEAYDTPYFWAPFILVGSWL